MPNHSTDCSGLHAGLLIDTMPSKNSPMGIHFYLPFIERTGMGKGTRQCIRFLLKSME